ncbi:pyrroline-5-carboxylate reductase [Desulfonatronospira sp.]|uniref:pyrroline-5-carboxylate reductase n=1 Tax=Desulfonatronospira sp. TaxID=1962951 RepID=UPI0025C31DCB|nr:pyrroline-5-carboxylate reductase [Desulfonatronospira sp.]
MTARLGIIGTGNMGGAMVQGLAARQDLELHGYDPDQACLERLAGACGLRQQPGPADLASECDYVVLAVKPGLVPAVAAEIAPALDKSKCLISVAAGVRTKDLVFWSNQACPVARVMPNTPALVGRGVFALCLEDENLSREQAGFIQGIFQDLGQVHLLPEKSFDSFTALIGSGPAYVYYFMESMVDAGVYMGLGRAQATEMVLELFAGSAHMAQQEGCHITQLKEMVTSPGGTTIAGLGALEKRAVKASVLEAVREAARRSRELGGE